MKPSTAFAIVLSLLPLASALPASADAVILADAAKEVDSLAQQAVDATLDRLDEEGVLLEKRGLKPTCTAKTLSIRKELYVSLTRIPYVRPSLTLFSGSLSKPERKAYTDAVLCLQSKKAKTPAAIAAGAKSRVSKSYRAALCFVLTW